MIHVIADHADAGTAVIPETAIKLHESHGWVAREGYSSEDPGELRRIVEDEHRSALLAASSAVQVAEAAKAKKEK
jgi:hypothetical protein